MKCATILEAVEDIKKGKLVIVVDDEERENEGDFITSAENATPEVINFMATHGRGLICIPMTSNRLDELKLYPMVPENTSLMGTPFTISVDVVEGTTTGISAADRACTVQALIDPRSKPEDLGRPGHTFPLRAQDGGVLVRAGHTEAAVDLARLAGMYPAGVLVEIMNENGTMARGKQLEKIAEKFDLKIISIADLIKHRFQTEHLATCLVKNIHLPTRVGDFKLTVYESKSDLYHHLVLTKGDVTTDDPVLVRMHAHCLTGDIFSSLTCDCHDKLVFALRMIQKEGRGVLVYMRQEPSGSRFVNNYLGYFPEDHSRKVDINHAQAKLGPEMGLRQYGIGAQILADLGLSRIRLMTNSVHRIVGLKSYGIEVSEQVPLATNSVIGSDHLS
ncbi:MAG: 3,4-dihydroxy-2-butanone-4-phosphate synthase [Candidatus Cloacimonetes bacterium 4572_55]|nr:MAG: 3,4-dihydroxy-2-butanone-4-phosphate synthase [Candidatus Cloacimonetes bacterium 4572_55]